MIVALTVFVRGIHPSPAGECWHPGSPAWSGQTTLALRLLCAGEGVRIDLPQNRTLELLARGRHHR